MTTCKCMLSLLLLSLLAVTAAVHQAEIDKLVKDIEELARHLMLQQLVIEERIRSDGNSGVKQIRGTHKGTRAYFGDTFNMGSMLSIHDHTNYDRTVGMGEFSAVMNGLEFRTRHNDYKLRMPSENSTKFHLLQDLPFPEVPPSVMAKHSVPDQIKEMREYFRAFKEQNSSIRHDYANYFKPVMCYVEGAWTTDTKSISEPFHSDRHFLDASSWFDLLEKVRFTSYTGGKSNFENYSFLPTTITDVVNGNPVYAQWNYRIICHPIRTRMGLSSLALIDDLGIRMAHRYSFEKANHARTARYRLTPRSFNRYNSTNQASSTLNLEYTGVELLDSIMNEIPGKDNYHHTLTDDAFGQTEYNMLNSGKSPQNAAYYHHLTDSKLPNAQGDHIYYKGFSDENLWVAETTQPRVAPMTVTSCQFNASVGDVTCNNHTVRYSYAVPLEIIWMTPLYTWNPYGLVFHTDNNVPPKNGRTGGTNATTAFNGTSRSYYYYTPNDFFKSNEVGRDPADTAKDVVGVLDKHGHVKIVKPSGTRIMLPEIDGVGKIRTRYPVAPSHHEGSPMYKEVDALKEMILDIPKNLKFFESPPFGSHNVQTHNPDDSLQHFTTTFTHKTPPGLHQHDVYVDAHDWSMLQRNSKVMAITTNDNEHSHTLQLQRDAHNHNQINIISCDNVPHCWDGHANVLLHMTD
ncbi:uncharacterized protein LOC110466724 [Mizuhopecten yessoensis]|uniref:Uncharacterized protein n=1 Tax=Mizuhopecten yessoensis TaxID=6573 RepID=A0A210PNK7_MIZYE|nr:uncharacterized protein LOC110466724 [Mizuhopecten yessoensis]OWF38072.1 hypothetical protein KP79_PYT12827 [Mizuhopecten yessoensis]